MYIKNKADLNHFLKIEAKRYNRKNLLMPLYCVSESDFLWKHNVLLRKAEYYKNTNQKILAFMYKFRLKRFQNLHQLHIPLNTFDCGLKIMHLGPVLVNGNAKAGKGISLHINTSIVAGGPTDEVPTLSDGVVVGVGAVIVGGVFIAKNIAIGANAVVTKSFTTENIAIAGVPARKVSDNGRLEWAKQHAATNVVPS